MSGDGSAEGLSIVKRFNAPSPSRDTPRSRVTKAASSISCPVMLPHHRGGRVGGYRPCEVLYGSDVETLIKRVHGDD